VRHVQLALEPLRTGAWSVGATRSELAARKIEIVSGMLGFAGEDYSSLDSIQRTGGVRPSERWLDNVASVRADARIAAELGLELVSFHAGFLPEPGDPERPVMVQRLRTIVDLLAEHGLRAAFETGQETAETLAGFLDELDRPGAGVNFDPANVILYDRGDPIDALRSLARRVLQVHVKDARRTEVKGTWGTEVPAGEGEVDWAAFFDVLVERGLACDLVIEREAGERRIEDARAARALVESRLALVGRDGR